MDEPKRPYYIPKEQRVLSALKDLVRALGDAVPKIDHSCTIKTNDGKAQPYRKDKQA